MYKNNEYITQNGKIARYVTNSLRAFENSLVINNVVKSGLCWSQLLSCGVVCFTWRSLYLVDWSGRIYSVS